MKELKIEDFDVLALYPKHEERGVSEVVMVRVIASLCKKFGYGRVSQVVKGVRDLMRNPDMLDEYRINQERFLNLKDKEQ